MPSRRPHTKSRHGCVRCKSKKVKCDEERPSCSRCARQPKQCDYENALLFLTPARPPPAAQLTPSGIPGRILSQMEGPFNPSHSRILPIGRSENFSCALLDLELLFHYTISTHNTLAYGNGSRKLWQVTVPQEAFSNRFLLHGLFSIAAFHLAHLQVSRAGYYNDVALRYHESAVGLLEPMLHAIGPDNAISLTAFAQIVAFNSCAMLQATSCPGKYFTASIGDTFSLVRKIQKSVPGHWTQKNPVPSILSFDNDKARNLLPHEVDKTLGALERCVHAEAGSTNLLAEYQHALYYLRRCFPGGELAENRHLVFGWPVLVSDEFWTAIAEAKPPAIAILGYFGVLLHALRGIWWVGDSG
ncbi:hypothetical protein BKA64DRAFT_629064 [Cadophora sp. MPI-SDFR-AT-0126]|nr:hypothetical protein BKA64DRAFT_629064 [Leotiomycetes sp. MPI-SDFR-AT-0126]